jgi:transcriptional regulator with XRE-family HTH domain
VSSSLSAEKTRLARKVRDLRLARRWTQAELAAQLGLSQNRLSEIERGGGSFTAEQFLAILRLFNVTTDHFVAAPAQHDAGLQNALARLGAAHLRESEDMLPSERLREVESAIREVLLAPESARLVAALAPVLIQNAEQANLNRLQLQLTDLGLEQRLGWLVENTLEAIRLDAPRAPKARQRLYRRAEVLLRAFLERVEAARARASERGPDVLDANIRSSKTLAEVSEAASPISQRWRIVTALQPGDFIEALRAARASD